MSNRLEFECVNCGKPIVLEGYYAQMMSFFDMPKRSVLCAKCVNTDDGGTDLPTTDVPSQDQDSLRRKPNQKEK